MTGNIGEFIHDSMKRMAPHLAVLPILGEMIKEEKESKRPPKKKCRQPPKYV